MDALALGMPLWDQSVTNKISLLETDTHIHTQEEKNNNNKTGRCRTTDMGNGKLDTKVLVPTFYFPLTGSIEYFH